MPSDESRHTFQIRIKGNSVGVVCADGQKLLGAIEQSFPFPHPAPVRVGCRKGGCGACRVKVISGVFDAEKMSRAHVTEDEQAQGYVLACRISPKSDLELEPAFRGPRRGSEEPI